MKRFVLILAGICGMLSCSRDLERGPSRADTIYRTPNDSLRGGHSGCEPGTYVTAVEFADHYDWRRDTAYGTAAGQIILYRDGDPIMAVAAGEAHEVSTDPDRHHFLDGHLLTEYIGSRGSVIKLDGEVVFRVAARESVKGILRSGKDLYVLSQAAGGSGFVLRKNWETLFSLGRGTLAGDMQDPSYAPGGAIYKDVGSICFAYYVQAAGSTAKTWHLVRDLEDITVTAPMGAGSICDVKSINGHICIAARSPDGRYPVICIDGTSYQIGGTFRVGNDLRLYAEKKDVRLYGSFTSNNQLLTYTGYCSPAGLLKYRRWDCSCFNGDKWVALRDGVVQMVGYPDDEISVGGQYRIWSHNCVSWTGEGVTMVLTPLSADSRPVIWTDGETQEMDINGYLSSVHVID